MSKEIIIRSLDGTPRGRFVVDGESTPGWSEVLSSLARRGVDTRRLDLKGLSFKGGGELRDLDLTGCDFSNATIPRLSFIDCDFSKCLFKGTRFRLVRGADNDHDVGLGSLFVRAKFNGSKLVDCDFVMSSLIDCSFSGARLARCDFRNVTWFDRLRYTAESWMGLDRVPDPFEGAELVRSRFGQPMGNALAVPRQMMVPPSFRTVWDSLGEPSKSFLRLSYMVGEPPEGRFDSSI